MLLWIRQGRAQRIVDRILKIIGLCVPPFFHTVKHINENVNNADFRIPTDVILTDIDIKLLKDLNELTGSELKLRLIKTTEHILSKNL
jgi:hypothetical protein